MFFFQFCLILIAACVSDTHRRACVAATLCVCVYAVMRTRANVFKLCLEI